MGQGKSLLITSIGNPQNYSFTTYSYRGEPKKGCVSSVVFDVVDKAIYVGLASLIDVRTHTQGEKTCGSTQQTNECAEKARKILEKYQGKSYGEYAELHHDAEEALEEYAESTFRSAHSIVVPPLGKPGEKYTFRFPPNTANTILLLKLYRECGEETYTRIMVDLTHGVNFLPTLCLKAAQLLSQIMLVRSRSAVSLEAYNADPYKPNIEKQEVNLVHSEAVENLTLYNLLQEPKKIKGDLRSLLQDEEREKLCATYSASKYLLKTLAHPYPLTLAYAAERFKRKADPKLVNVLVNQILEKCEWSDNTAKTQYEVDELYAFQIILAYEVAKQVSKIAVWNNGYTLDTIEKLAELYGIVAQPYTILIKQEISKIKEKLKTNQGFRGTLAELYGHKDTPNQMDKRIMVAHAGFQMEFIHLEEGRAAYYDGERRMDPRDEGDQEELRSLLDPTF